MALTQVSTGGIKDGQVHTADLADAQITAGKLHADALDRTYTLGADGINHYTFTGEGLTGAVNDPTLYLTRGKTYRFVNGNSAGAHPFRIQTTVNGSAGTEYNTGVTNNGGAGGSTIVFEVPHDAPDVLYYQCTSHGSMGGILYVTGALADGTVTTAKLAADAVDGTKIADDSINSEHYVDGSIDTAHIADQAVDLTKLPHGTSSNDGKFLRANNGADPTFESLPSSGLSNIVEDTTPQLGGDLDLNGNIISVGDGGRDANQEHIRFGTDGDLRIYHTAGGDSTIEHNSAGTDLILKTGSSADDVLIQPQDDFLVQVAGATKNSIISRNDGATELYWQGSSAGKKFETTSTGAQMATGDDPVTLVLQNTDLNTPTDSGGEIIFKGTKNSGNPLFFGAIAGKRRNQPSDETAYLAFYRQNGDGGSTGVEAMRIDHGGNVMINSTINNNGTGNNTPGFCFQPQRLFGSGTGHAPLALNRSNTGIVALWYRDGSLVGNVSVGSGSVSYNSGSDYRLKENVINLTGAIDRLKTLAPKRFNFIADPTKTVDGFIAHEVTAVPEAVTGTKDEVALEDNDDLDIKKGEPIMQQIDQSKLVPLLTAALQEAIAKIETLETKVAALEAG